MGHDFVCDDLRALQARRRCRGRGRPGPRRAARRGRRRRRRRPPRSRGRGGAGGHPPLRLPTRRATSAGSGRSPWPAPRGTRASPSTRSCWSPGEEAIVAPAWVPYRERLQPGDMSPGDLLPVDDDDPRLVPTYSFGDDPLDADDKAQVRTVAQDLGLGRVRTLLGRGPRARRPAVVRRRRRPGRAAGRAPRPTRATPAASCCGSRGRSPTRSASAPTATPTTTAGWCPSTTAAGRTRRSGSPSGTSRSRSRSPSSTPSDARQHRALLSLAQAGSQPRRSAASCSRRARRSRRQYSRPNRPRPKPARQVHSHHRLPDVLEAAVERQQRQEPEQPQRRSRPRRCGRRRRRAARRRPPCRCGCRSRAVGAGRRGTPRRAR